MEEKFGSLKVETIYIKDGRTKHPNPENKCSGRPRSKSRSSTCRPNPAPGPAQPVPQPVPAQLAPAGVVPQIFYQNWIGKKLEFSR